MSANDRDEDALRRLRGVDVYLVDQILKGRPAPGARIADIGAGSGRNLTWFLTSDAGYRVDAVEPNPAAVEALLEHCRAQGASTEQLTVHTAALEDVELEPRAYDLVIVNALLHFARDLAQFDAWIDRSFELVAPGGVLFARFATTIGIEDRVRPLGNRWYALPDGSDRFLADEALLRAAEARIGATRIEPLRTTVVERLRAMTTWVIARVPS